MLDTSTDLHPAQHKILFEVFSLENILLQRECDNFESVDLFVIEFL